MFKLKLFCSLGWRGLLNVPGLQGISARSPVTLRKIEQGLILIADLPSFRNHFPFLNIATF